MDKGKLYLVGTPIGNLGDMSTRAIEVLNAVNTVAAEDTRVSRKLFTRFEIKTYLTSYHKYSDNNKRELLIDKMLNGEDVALISDAGMPGISDPGEHLVIEAIKNGIEVLTVPGPSATLAALVVSGLSMSRFVFEGFLAKATKEKREQLEKLVEEERTIIFYVSPHQVKKDLEAILAVIGNRRASLSREITKLHEETIRGSITDLIEVFEEKEPRGEMVLVIEGQSKKIEFSLDEAYQEMIDLIANGLKVKKASSLIGEKYNISKRELYNRYLGDKKE